jgi:hypothetical protein
MGQLQQVLEQGLQASADVVALARTHDLQLLGDMRPVDGIGRIDARPLRPPQRRRLRPCPVVKIGVAAHRFLTPIAYQA